MAQRSARAHTLATGSEVQLQQFPSIRASAVRDALTFLDDFEHGAQRRVLEQVPAASRSVIESTPGTSWISIEHDHYTVDAIIDLFGRERAICYWRDLVATLVNRPLLSGFVSNLIRLLGREPVSVVRGFAKAWPLVYRDLCEPQLIATSDGQPTIRFANLASELRRYPNYLDSWYGACQGFAHIAQVRGHVQFEVASDRSWAEAKFFWE